VSNFAKCRSAALPIDFGCRHPGRFDHLLQSVEIALDERLRIIGE
jgi:hypothetical protein